MSTAVQIADDVRTGIRSAAQVVKDSLERIEQLNPGLNAFIRIDADGGIEQAHAIDRMVAAGQDPGALAGVPIGVKDMEPCRGFAMTQGSWFLRDAAPEAEDSRHVARLRAAGAVIIGITACSEFGMDSATSSLLWGTTRNPWNPEKTPGGSSGGSSAAVAAGMVPLATGTDAGGSIREPAAFTGILGLKPSHGRIPKMNGFANWAVHGALARTAADAARHLDVASGPHDGDRQSLPAFAGSFEASIETLDVTGLRATWTADYGYAPVETEVIAICHDFAQRLIRSAGLVQTAVPFHPVNIYRHFGAIMGANLEAEFTRDGILPDGFDMLSKPVQSLVNKLRAHRDEIDVQHSWQQVHLLEQQVAELFSQTDLLLSPATSCAPYGADQLVPEIIAGRDASETGAEPFGMLANACWNPSISIPAGFTAQGLPVGLQITARRHRDDILLRLARIAEIAAPWPLFESR
jgi:aspartyl-tRNA(Asn)/glutamyl-tRNA(Gln) amidotransferase subunit A